jgi:hypothetical protein
MDIAELLTDRIIQKSGNSTSQECLVSDGVGLASVMKLIKAHTNISLYVGIVPDTMV